MENCKGIDYGMGSSNIDNNGIRYGVIPAQDVGEAWYEGSEAYYAPTCPACGSELPDLDERDCECGEHITEDSFDMMDPDSHFVKDADYVAEQVFDDPDIFVLKSPYYTYAQFCSPCAPGACYLRNPIKERDANNKCYCFGHDWFEGEKAPYPVYDIKTDKQV